MDDSHEPGTGDLDGRPRSSAWSRNRASVEFGCYALQRLVRTSWACSAQVLGLQEETEVEVKNHLLNFRIRPMKTSGEAWRGHGLLNAKAWLTSLKIRRLKIFCEDFGIV